MRGCFCGEQVVYRAFQQSCCAAACFCCAPDENEDKAEGEELDWEEVLARRGAALQRRTAV